jgi:hypothetical protein
MLGVSRRTFYDYLEPATVRVMPVEVVERFTNLRAVVDPNYKNSPFAAPLKSLQDRFTEASILLFGWHHYVGFATGDHVKRKVLERLVNLTGYNERTIRRYLPVRDASHNVPRSIVEAFEDAVCRVGCLVP